MKKTILIIVCIIILCVSAVWVSATIRANEIKIPVLLYHEINDNPQNMFALSINDFKDQMNYLKDNCYTPVSMSEFKTLMDRNNTQVDRTKKYILITFDDGYKNAYDNAVPILNSLNFTATFFIVPGILNTNGYMTSEQVKLLSDKFDIENHTLNHNWLPGLKYDEQLENFITTNVALENIIGKKIMTIAYPYGNNNIDTVVAAKEAGLDIGFICNDGMANSLGNPMLTNRQIIWRGITIREFQLLMTEVMSLQKGKKH